MQSVEVNSLADLPKAAKHILGSFPGKKIFALYGQMGAGKTTLIKELCGQLGVKENTSSPTFAIVNEYRDRDGNPLFHFDFYRISKPSEALDIGLEEYLSGENHCFIEWPEMVEEFLPPVTVRLKIEPSEQKRLISEVK